jgi:serine/threonine protein kinase
MGASEGVADVQATRRLPRRGTPWTGLKAGTTIKHYEVIRQLGRGGMGDVYLARDTRLGRQIALKFLLEATSPEPLMAEARTTAGLKHDNIVTLHDIDEYRGVPYMVLEHIHGRTFAELLEACPPGPGGADAVGLPVERAVELIIPVVRALVCAHEARIVHRDLKPSNVMISDNGSVKVLDFGVATMLDDAVDAEPGSPDVNPGRGTPRGAWTATGNRKATGSRPYMSPEQWGVAPVDQRTDLWAVGIMLYEMVTGRHPLAETPVDQIGKEVMDLSTEMPSVLTRRPGLGKLGTVIDRCLVKRREGRIESARALLLQLESLGLRQRRVSMLTLLLTGTGVIALAAALAASSMARADRRAAAAAPSITADPTPAPPLAVLAEGPPAAPAATGIGSVPGSPQSAKPVRPGLTGVPPKALAPHVAAKAPRPSPAASPPKPAGAAADGLFDRE